MVMEALMKLEMEITIKMTIEMEMVIGKWIWKTKKKWK